MGAKWGRENHFSLNGDLFGVSQHFWSEKVPGQRSRAAECDHLQYPGRVREMTTDSTRWRIFTEWVPHSEMEDMEDMESRMVISHDGSMYAIYGNMDPININPLYVTIYQHHGSRMVI